MARIKDMDLGLAISGALLPPGKTRTCVEIAAFAGCSKQNIEQLENRALRKLRHRVLFNPELREILHELITPPTPRHSASYGGRRTHHPVI